MTRTTNTQYLEDQATRTVFESPKIPVPYPSLLHQAQGEVGRNMGRATMSGVRWIGGQWTNFWRALADTAQPPASA